MSLDGIGRSMEAARLLVTRLTLYDGIALREALFNFFSQAREALSSRQRASA